MWVTARLGPSDPGDIELHLIEFIDTLLQTYDRLRGFFERNGRQHRDIQLDRSLLQDGDELRP